MHNRIKDSLVLVVSLSLIIATPLVFAPIFLIWFLTNEIGFLIIGGAFVVGILYLTYNRFIISTDRKSLSKERDEYVFTNTNFPQSLPSRKDRERRKQQQL